jgi:hypothetical protein
MKFEKSNFMKGLSRKSRPFHPTAPAQGEFDGPERKNYRQSQQEVRVSYYISRLLEATEREAEELASLKAAHADDTRERLTPLQDRLSRLLTTIPAEVLAEGVSLSALQAGLRGRWRGACHPGELGAALRKAGFVRRRKWVDDDGFRSLWFRSAK